ncbi:uncharacterized protein LOC143900397 isoform X2 [Temnothorax americanus]|uniref:uncharacterized protein LOC143900397 isoform X2 n=1 Tax=Temnothorax americanus TaxID=1964332 RepID=UPI004069864C
MEKSFIVTHIIRGRKWDTMKDETRYHLTSMRKQLDYPHSHERLPEQSTFKILGNETDESRFTLPAARHGTRTSRELGSGDNDRKSSRALWRSRAQVKGKLNFWETVKEIYRKLLNLYKSFSTWSSAKGKIFVLEDSSYNIRRNI